jgi:hypothetical protein
MEFDPRSCRFDGGLKGFGRFSFSASDFRPREFPEILAFGFLPARSIAPRDIAHTSCAYRPLDGRKTLV